MDTSILVALIGAGATIAAAVITALLQRPRERETNSSIPPTAPPPHGAPPHAPRAETDQPAQMREEAAPIEEVEEFLALPGKEAGKGAPPAEEGVRLPCPGCGRDLRAFPRMWFKRVRCKSCRTLLKLSPIPGTSIVLKPGTVNQRKDS